jgi:hypothetical protein
MFAIWLGGEWTGATTDHANPLPADAPSACALARSGDRSH